MTFQRSDFVSGQDVRWCPGCGDYAILGAMQQALARCDIPREKHVFVSGIGCSSRFPYYMNTYGFHTIHGRAPAIATGLRCVNPDLHIWVVTGDGDGLSIGGNHLIHALRRNLNFKILLVNNRIYGLTKGQYSPTTPQGQKTKSSPYGALEKPLNPLSLAVTAEATFIARTADSDPRHMTQILERAVHHTGAAFIEVFQNCIIFNDKTFAPVTGRENREDRVVYLEDGKPLVFGQGRNKTLRLKGLSPQVVDLPSDGDTTGLWIHNEKDPSPNPAWMLSSLLPPEMPMPFGVFRAVERPTYDSLLDMQIKEVTSRLGAGKLQDLLYTEDTWTVKP